MSQQNKYYIAQDGDNTSYQIISHKDGEEIATFIYISHKTITDGHNNCVKYVEKSGKYTSITGEEFMESLIDNELLNLTEDIDF